MSQAVPIHPDRAEGGIRIHFSEWHPRLDFTRIAYGVKVALALLIAVWVELRFNLGMADSAAICVLVVKSNVLGTTIQKSMLRMIGNLIGCSIGFLFIALFAQDRIAGTLVFSLYSVVCCFFLQRSRYAPAWHWIYDSAAIVFVFHLGSATETFTFTAERWLELSIGILSMTLVSSILWPSVAGTVFEKKFLAMLAALAENIVSVQHMLLDGNSKALSPQMLAGGMPELHSQLETARKDTPRYERFYSGYQCLLGELQSLVARTALLGDSVAQLAGASDKMNPARQFIAIRAAVDQLKAVMDSLVVQAQRSFEGQAAFADAADIQEIRTLTERARMDVTSAGLSLREVAAALYVCESIDSLSERIESFSESLGNAEQSRDPRPGYSAIQPLDSDDSPFWKRWDVRKALVSGLTVGLTFAVWMATNWPAGAFAVFFVVLITSKNCTAPYLPPKALIPGALVGLSVGAAIYLGVLPALDGFMQLALVLFSFCAIGGYLMLSPNAHVAGVAGLTTIVTIKLIDVQAHQTVSFSHVVGFSYGVLGGTFLAFILLGVLWPIVPERMLTQQMNAIFGSCRKWLAAISTESGTSRQAQVTFTHDSVKRLGLFMMWGRYLNYSRLPAGQQAVVNKLAVAMQSALLHLSELGRSRNAHGTEVPGSWPNGIVKRVDQSLCDWLDRLADSLVTCSDLPGLPDLRSSLDELESALADQCEDGSGGAGSGTMACRTLVAIGQYRALLESLGQCRVQLEQLARRSLNQSYL